MGLKTHELGPLFVGVTPPLHDDVPMFHVARSWEDEEPFREAETRLLRLWPFKRALIWGWWYDTGIETQEDLDHALGLRTLPGTAEDWVL